MQTEEGAQEERPAALGSILNIYNEGWVGDSTVLQDTQGPSCLQIDLICKAATHSGAEGFLARAGMTDRDGNFS